MFSRPNYITTMTMQNPSDRALYLTHKDLLEKHTSKGATAIKSSSYFKEPIRKLIQVALEAEIPVYIRQPGSYNRIIS